MKYKQLSRYIMFFMLVSSMTYGLEISSVSQAVDVAGKQRMFTQRMLKDYAMIGMQNTFGKPDEDLITTIKSFDDAANALLSYGKSDAVKQSIEKMNTLWTPLKKTLQSTATVDNVAKLQEDLEVLLKVADETTKLFEKESESASGKIVNISGRQRMLSQRMASLYMLKVWGVNDPEFKEKMDKAMELFKTSLVKLEKSELNTKEINQYLKKVKRSYMFFEMMNKSKSKFVPTLIYKKSNDILKNMNSATQAYVALETK